MRKFFTEFGLNVSTSYKTIIPVEYLQEVKDEHDYHIYFILSCAKIFIVPDSITTDEKSISLQLYKLDDGKINSIQDVKFSLSSDIDHRELKIKCSYPHTNLSIMLANGQEVCVDAQAALNYGKIGNEWILDVLYIGQSYGRQGNRIAQDRLKAHSTLQKILTDYNVKHPDKRIYIFLLEICPILNTVMDGIHKGSVSDEDEDAHFFNVFANPLKMEQIINVTEAALINYFKPEYNVNFVDNFPDNEHKGYSQYFDLDYNSISVELDLDFEYPYPQIQLKTKTNCIKSSWDFIQYDLSNDPNRDNMYSLFGKKADV